MKFDFNPNFLPLYYCFNDNAIRFFIDDLIFEKEIPSKIKVENPLSKLDYQESGTSIPLIYLREAYFFTLLNEKEILEYNFESYFIKDHDLLKKILLKLRAIKPLIESLKNKPVFKDKSDFLKDVIRYAFRCLYFKLFEAIRYTQNKNEKGIIVLKDYLNTYNNCLNNLENKMYEYQVKLMHSHISFFERSLFDDVYPNIINKERYFFFESFVKGKFNNLFLGLFLDHFSVEIKINQRNFKKELKNFHFHFKTLLSFDNKCEDIQDISYTKSWMRFYNECYRQAVKNEGE